MAPRISKNGNVYSPSRGGRPWARKCAVVFDEEEDCWLCLQPVDFSLSYLTEFRKENPGYKSVDHIIPVTLGGTDDRDNLKLSHLLCNKLKGELTREEWVSKIESEGLEISTIISNAEALLAEQITQELEAVNPQSKEW